MTEIFRVCLPVSLLVKLYHTQHGRHDEEHQYGVKQDVLGDGDAARICQEVDA